MNNHPWLLLDTETTGLKAPIYVVELAAQRMRGWQPDGPAFSRLLNHGVAIPPEATRVNGCASPSACSIRFPPATANSKPCANTTACPSAAPTPPWAMSKPSPT